LTQRQDSWILALKEKKRKNEGIVESLFTSTGEFICFLCIDFALAHISGLMKL
jgi:hypothetical protein